VRAKAADDTLKRAQSERNKAARIVRKTAALDIFSLKVYIMPPSLNILVQNRMSRAALFFFILQITFWSGALRAAENETKPGEDLNGLLPPGFMDSLNADSSALGNKQLKSPGGAVLRALTLPGWGQFYTGHRIRGSVTAVFETAFFTASFFNYRERNRSRTELHLLEREIGGSLPLDDPERDEITARIKILQQKVKNRQLKGGDYLAYGVTTLILSLIDSYVSAHLYRFDTNFQAACGGYVEISFRF